MSKTGEAQPESLAAPAGQSPRRAAPAQESFRQSLELLAGAELSDPSTVLGPHPVDTEEGKALAIRCFFPGAQSVQVILCASGGQEPQTFQAAQIHSSGVFQAILPAPAASRAIPGGYRFAVTAPDGSVRELHDAYNFPALLTDFDLYLIGEGTHYEKYTKLGAHPREVAGVQGVNFAVWAPNAMRVSAVGDFNQWDGRVNALRPRGRSGVWELFVPQARPGATYKYEIKPRGSGPPMLKSDPYGVYAELRPRSGSIVYDLSGYAWGDSQWMSSRAERNALAAPLAAYEVHAGSWRREIHEGGRWLTYRELADQLIPYVKKLGYTHIELLPIMEYPLDASWGYQTIGYFAPTSRYGTPHDLMYFIDRCHQEDLGVLLDWTPAHFPADGHGLGNFDGTHLYEHADPRQGRHPDWGTLVFNYGRTEVRNFLISNALYWLDRFHADGLRVDAVASMLYLDYSRRPGEWLPNEYGGRENLAATAFIKRLNEVVHGRFPGTLMVAEESTAWPGVSRPTYLGGLGFTLKWNLGWMNDTLSYFAEDPIHRKYHHNQMTFSMLYAFTENFLLPLSHDEVVYGKRSLLHKMPGDMWQQFANLRLLYGFHYAHPGKKLLFMGGEFAQRDEWNFDVSLDWHLLEFPLHRGVQQLVCDLNRIYRSEPALHQVDFDWHGFEWLDANEADSSVFSFIRRGRDPDDYVIVVANCTPVPRENYRIGVPEPGYFREILNTDAGVYGGTNLGNLGAVKSDPIPWLGREHSVGLRLPPLGVLFLKPGR